MLILAAILGCACARAQWTFLTEGNVGLPRSETDAWIRLASWDADERIPPAMYERLQGHPNYPATIQGFAARVLDISRIDVSFDGICKDVSRYGAAQWVVYLHLTGGLNLPRLKQMCVSSRLLSPGRARALLLYLRYIDFVEPLGRREHGEAAQYRPTAALFAAWIALARAALEAMALVEPATNAAIAKLGERDFLHALLRHMGEGFLQASMALPQDTSFFRVFLHRNAGLQFLYWMIVMARDHGDGFPPRKPIALNISAVAQDLNVSRTHVRRMLRAAEEEGLLLRGEDSRVQFTAELAFDSEFALSTLILGYVISAVKAQRELSLQSVAAIAS
ncbi:MAG: hypothetical protein JSR81_16080 [Proteobacteria bacterium]|nr:hypothetical protein [Pseudomonadota bacterium]